MTWLIGVNVLLLDLALIVAWRSAHERLKRRDAG